MPLSPEDVAAKQFTSTRLGRGYDEAEVDDFLDEVEAELTRLHRENDDLRAKLAQAQRSAAESGVVRQAQPEQRPVPAPAPVPAQAPPPPPPPVVMAPAPPPPQAAVAPPAEQATAILAMAQRTAEGHVGEARQMADRIVGEARSRADQVIREAEDRQRQVLGTLEAERNLLERKVEDLRGFEREYRSRLKTYIEGQLRDLEGRDDVAKSMSGGAIGSRSSGSPFSSSPASLGVGTSDGPGGPPQQPRGGYVMDEGPER